MVDTYNPLGTDGFEFVEYTAVDHKGIEQLKALFVSLGFAEIAKHRSKEAWLYRQGDINFIVNEQPHSQAEAFAKVHGPSVCGMAFRVNEATAAMEQAFKGGGEEYKTEIGPMELSIPAIYGIGESLLYFVDRYGKQSIYDVDFRFYDDA
ncbi:4-hydroxyphenylpyruvate dioxygenase, partial [Vibrio sp. 10N.222.51.A6]